MAENIPHPPHTCTLYSPLSLTRFSCLKALNSIHSQVILVLISVSSFWVPAGSSSVPPFSDLSFSLRLGCFFPSVSLPPKAHLHTTRFFPDNISFPSTTANAHTVEVALLCLLSSSHLLLSPRLLPAQQGFFLPFHWCSASSCDVPHLKKETVTLAPFLHRWHPGGAVAAFSSFSL